MSYRNGMMQWTGGSGGDPAWDDVTGKPDTFAPSVHSHSVANVTGLQSALDGKQAAGSYAAEGHTHSALEIIGLPSGSDPWTYVKLTNDFVTSSSSAVDITGLSFLPILSRQYEFEAVLFLRTATTTVGPRPGLAWPTGLVDGVATVDTPTSATARAFVNGNINASLLGPVGGLPNTTQSYPAYVAGTFITGLLPVGSLRLQMASETAGTNVTVKAGSFLKWRTI